VIVIEGPSFALVGELGEVRVDSGSKFSEQENSTAVWGRYLPLHRLPSNRQERGNDVTSLLGREFDWVVAVENDNRGLVNARIDFFVCGVGRGELVARQAGSK
jgi:hypothetical protein